MEIVPSILSADFGQLTAAVQTVAAAGAQTIHIDVMDGHFVPNLSFGPQTVAALRRATNLTLEVHLMVEQPEDWVTRFADAGADRILVHQEATPHLHRALALIKAAGKEAGVVLNPGTSVATVTPLLAAVNQVLVMTVDPGFGGQQFLQETIAKLDELVTYRQTHPQAAYRLEVDGGVNPQTLPQLSGHGVDLAVAGSAVFAGQDAGGRFTALTQQAKQVTEAKHE